MKFGVESGSRIVGTTRPEDMVPFMAPVTRPLGMGSTRHCEHSRDTRRLEGSLTDSGPGGYGNGSQGRLDGELCCEQRLDEVLNGEFSAGDGRNDDQGREEGRE